MDGTWMIMQSAAGGSDLPRSVPRGTLPRIRRFAARHRVMLSVFLALTTASAVIGVATPVLVGRVVDAIVGRTGIDAVVGLAGLIAGLAVLDAGADLRRAPALQPHR